MSWLYNAVNEKEGEQKCPVWWRLSQVTQLQARQSGGQICRGDEYSFPSFTPSHVVWGGRMALSPLDKSVALRLYTCSYGVAVTLYRMGEY
jgi:hypothetical protein